MWSIEQMMEYVNTQRSDANPIDRLLEHIHEIHGSKSLEDDFSMVRIEL